MKKRLLILCILLFTSIIFFCMRSLQSDLPGKNDLKEAQEFYAVREADLPAKNGFYVLYGLSAPENIGLDVYQWSEKRISPYKKEFDKKQAEIEKATSGMSAKEIWRFYMDNNGYNGFIPAKDEFDSIPNKITFHGSLKNTECWVDNTLDRSSEECLLQDQVKVLINTNQLLLKRYKKLSDYDRYVDVPFYLGDPGLQIKTHSLFLLDLVLEARSNPDKAARAWIENALYLKKALSDQNTFVTRAVLMMMYNRSQKAMPSIISQSETVRKYKKELTDLLGPFGPKEMNLTHIFYAEYGMAQNVLIPLGPQAIYKFYKQQQELLAISNAPSAQFDAMSEKLNEEYKFNPGYFSLSRRFIAYLLAYSFNQVEAMSATIMDIVLPGMARSSELIRYMHKIDAYNRMLNMYVRMKAKNLSPETIIGEDGSIAVGNNLMDDITYHSAYQQPNKEQLAILKDTNEIQYQNDDLDIQFRIKF